MRWQHPRLGLVPPGRFIPLAEACGLIAALGELALSMACSQAAVWQRQGLPRVPIAVNLSALQWAQPGLADVIRCALADSGLDAQWLELELTESTSMQDPLATIVTMELLRKMGVKVSIDDFGTGFCNLSYLKRFPVDKLKIDQSFVSEITCLPDDLVISQLVVAMGHLLHLEVVAEGVETLGQLTLLAEAGCDIMQGYYFSRPLEPEACARLLAEGERLPAPKRLLIPHALLWLHAPDGESEQAGAWLAGTAYHLIEAGNSLDAFEILATRQIGIVIADQNLLGMTGDEFLRRVSKMYPQTITILIRDTENGPAEPLANRLSLQCPPTRSSVLAALKQGFVQYGRQSILG
jgi:EAL domain-containing protein (putative c-di-GMP-specific phosphodiesterase class I)